MTIDCIQSLKNHLKSLIFDYFFAKMLHAHKKNSYYTLAIFYCTFCVRKHTIFNPARWWNL